MTHISVLILIFSVFFGSLNSAEACQFRSRSAVGKTRIYSKPTDDSEPASAYSVDTLFMHRHEIDCHEVTPDGWVRITHGWIKPNGERSYNGWVPVEAFDGSLTLKNGSLVPQDSVTSRMPPLPPVLPDRESIPNVSRPDGNLTGRDAPVPPVSDTETPNFPVVGDRPVTSGNLPPPQSVPGENFLNFFRRVATAGPTHRSDGLRYGLPMRANRTEDIPSVVADTSQEGPCGGLHIRKQRTDPYMNPTTACLFAGVAQEWRRNFCPDNGPNCRIIYGDAGHDGSPNGWPHASHQGGECIDIWPMRKGLENMRNLNVSPNNSFTYRSPEYSPESTKQFAQVLLNWNIETTPRPGGNGTPQMFFDDPSFSSMGFKAIGGHADHFHVCFRDNAANRKKCTGDAADPNSGFRRDPNICHFGQASPAGTSRPDAVPPAVVPPAENRNGSGLEHSTF